MYALLCGTVIYHELNWDGFVQSLKDSVVDTGGIILIIAMSGIFSYALTVEKVPTVLGGVLLNLTDNPQIMMIMIILFLTVTGMVIDSNVNILLFTPLILPVLTEMGVDPVHFGIIMMTIVTMGCMAPPVGTACYSVCDIMGCPISEYVKYSIPILCGRDWSGYCDGIHSGCHPVPAQSDLWLMERKIKREAGKDLPVSFARQHTRACNTFKKKGNGGAMEKGKMKLSRQYYERLENVFSIGYKDTAGTSNARVHRHDQYELLLCLSDGMFLTVDGEGARKIRKNTLLIFNSVDLHQFGTKEPEGENKRYVLYFDPSYVD